MAHIPFEHALVLAGLLFVIGLAGLIARRNLFMALLSIEIMLNAAGLAFAVAGAKWHQPDGQIMFLFILAAAAAEVAVGLALAIRYNHHVQSLDIDVASTLRD